MPVLQKRCANCNRLFGPRVLPNGKTEYPNVFKKKRFCSPTCGAIGNAVQRKVERTAAQPRI